MRPNILLITTDQQRFDTIQAAGYSHVWTPHLNWLCDSGIRFDNAYSDCPVCLPARTTMMTGRYAWNHRVMSNRWVPGACEPTTSLAGRLTAAGYQTRLIGKQHHAPSHRHLMGFMSQNEKADFFREKNRVGTPAWTHGLGGNENAPGIDGVPSDKTLTRWCVDKTVEFLETRDTSMPFFAWLSFNEPHPPLTPTADFWSLYRDRPQPARVTGNWSSTADAMPPAWQAVTRELSQTQRLGDTELHQVRQAYAALVTQVDYQLGELFGMLNDTKLLENTLIIFTSDHGEMLGDHWLGGKCVPFEASARVPMIVRPPHAMRAHQTPGRGQVSNALVCLADILPTCLSAAQLPKAEGIDGIDLLQAWRGEEQRDILFGTCGFMHYIREKHWKYCRETLGGSELLFDLAADPLEQHDLVCSGTQTNILTALRAKMERHLDQHDLRQAASADPAVAKNLQNLPENTCPGFTSESGRPL